MRSPRPTPVGAVPSPNVWRRPEAYERLNLAADPDGLVDAALRRVSPWAGGHVVDIGCGTGFHLPRYAADARAVTGVEPHAGLVARARARVAGLPAVSVVAGLAQALPLPSRCADAAHARWAYFFGPGCEPGLAEAWRVLRPGATLAVVDVDLTAAAGYPLWLRRARPQLDGGRTERFWARLGFDRLAVPVVWRFASRDDLAEVLHIEFPPAVASAVLSATPGTELAVPSVVRSRRLGLA